MSKRSQSVETESEDSEASLVATASKKPSVPVDGSQIGNVTFYPKVPGVIRMLIVLSAVEISRLRVVDSMKLNAMLRARSTRNICQVQQISQT